MTTPIEQAARVADLALALGAIRLCVARWASYDKAERDRQGLSTPPDTHIVAPPVWPTHGQLAAWVDHLDRAEEALSDAGMLVGEGYVVVPKEPTEAMVKAAHSVWSDHEKRRLEATRGAPGGQLANLGWAEKYYRAMIAAAPQSTGGGE